MTTTRARAGRRCLPAAVGMVLSGCSFVTVQRPAPIAEDPRVTEPCTTSVQAPVADTILAGAALVGAWIALMVAVSDEWSACYGQEAGCTTRHGNYTPALALVGAGALFGSSAAYGFVGSHQCKRRTSLTGQCANGSLAACRAVTPGWTPLPSALAPRSVPPPPQGSAPSPPPRGEGGWVDVPVGPTPPPPDAQWPPDGR